MISSQEALNRSKQIDHSQEPVQELREILLNYEFSDRNMCRFEVPIGTKVIRVRANKSPEEAALSPDKVLYTKMSELSYPPADVTKYNRANIPHKPLFYAALPSKNKDNNQTDIYSYIATSFLETIKMKPEMKQMLTFSVWETTREIILFNVPTRTGLFKQESHLYRQRLNEYIGCLLYYGIPNPLEDVFIQYLATEMSRPKDDNTGYFLTAHFVNYVLHHFTEFDGVLYLSTKMSGYTENIALLPKCVDSSLKLIDVSVKVAILDQNLNIGLHDVCKGIIVGDSEIAYELASDFIEMLANKE